MATNSTLIPDWYREQEENKSQASLTPAELQRRWGSFYDLNSQKVSPIASSYPNLSTNFATKTSTPAMAPSTAAPMKFEVGAGLTPAQKTVAEEVVRKPALVSPEVKAKLPFVPLEITASGRGLGEQAIAGFVEWPERIAKSFFQIAKTVTGQKTPLSPELKQSKLTGKTYEPVQTSIDELNRNLNEDPYFKEHPYQAFSLAFFSGMIDVLLPFQYLEKAMVTELAKLPPATKKIEEAKLSLGFQPSEEVTPQALTQKYRQVAHVVHPDKGGTTEAMKKLNKNYDVLNQALTETENGILPSLQSKARVVAEKLNTKVSDLFKTGEGQPYLGVKGLLPEQAGYVPVTPYQPFRQPAMGLSLREVNMAPLAGKEITAAKPLANKIVTFDSINKTLTEVKEKQGQYTPAELKIPLTPSKTAVAKEVTNRLADPKELKQLIDRYERAKLQVVELEKLVKTLDYNPKIEPVTVKEPRSIINKIIRKRTDADNPRSNYWVQDLNDIVRVNVIYNSEREALDALKKANFDFSDYKNFIENPSKLGFRGINIDVTLSDGSKAEIQLHTPSTIQTKEIIHDLYADEIRGKEIPKKLERYSRYLSDQITAKTAPEEWQVHITNVKGAKEQPVDVLVDEGRALETEGKYDEAIKKYEEAVTPGVKEIDSLFKGSKETKIIINKPSVGRFFGFTEPTIYLKLKSYPEKIDSVFKQLSALGDEKFGQTSVYISRDLTGDPGYGIINKEMGISYEPAVDIFTTRKLTLADNALLDELFKKYDLAGATIKPDGSGVELFNLTFYNDNYEQFKNNVLAFAEDLQRRNLWESARRRVKEIRSASVNEEGGLLTYGQLRTGVGRNLQTLRRSVEDAIKSKIKTNQPVTPSGAGFNIQMYGETPGLQPFKAAPSLAKLGIKPVAPKIDIGGREDVLLRKKLRLEERASKLGYKAGTYVARIDILDKLRIKRENIKDIKDQVIGYIKENLPLRVRGKFLVMVRSVSTQKGLAKAFVRVDKEVASVARAELITQLKKNLNRIKDSNQIAVDYKEKIGDLINAIEIPRHQAATLDRLRKTKEYLEKQAASGEEVEMPKRVLEALEILGRKPLSELSLVEIELLNDKILAIEHLGRTKWKTLQNIFDIEKQEKKKELLENTFPIETKELMKPGIGQRLTVDQRIKNNLYKAFNEAQRIDLAITPMDVVFDLLDGSLGYTGSNYKIFKKKLDSDFGGYLNLKDNFGDKAWDWAKKYNLDEKNYERIGIHAARSQENGVEKLINSGYTEDEISSIQLTDGEQKFYDTMRKNLDALRPLIADVMREVYNQPVGDVKNYFSFMTDWKAMDEAEVYQRITNPQEFKVMPTKKPEMGFTKKRTGAGKQKIKINAMEIYLKHIDNAAYLVSMARDLKMLFEIANSPEYKAVAGDRGQKIVLEWIDTMSRKGGVAGQVQLAVLDTLRKNIGAAVLGFRLSSTLVQPTALLDGAGMIGNYAFRGVSNVLGKDSRAWIEFLNKNFPELRDRGLDDPAFTEFSDNKMIAKIQKAGFTPMRVFDKMTASSITSGAYMKYLDEHGLELDFNNPNFEGISYAEKILRRTQASPLFKDVPLAMSKGALTGNKSVDKIILQFQNFLLNRWSMIRHDLYRVGLKLPDPFSGDYKTNERNLKLAFSIFIWLALASLAGVGIRRGTRKMISLFTGTEPQRDSFIKELMREYLATIPFMSQFVSVAVYERAPVSGLETFEKTVIEGYKALSGEGKKPETKMRHWINFITGLASVKGIPGTMQLQQILNQTTYRKSPSKGTETNEFDNELKRIRQGSGADKFEKELKRLRGE